MAENIPEKHKFGTDPQKKPSELGMLIPVTGEEDANFEQGEEYLKWQTERNQHLYYRGTRRMVELLERKGRSQQAKEEWAEYKDSPTITEADKKYFENLMLSEKREKLLTKELVNEYEISKILSIRNHEKTLEDNQNFIPVLPYQTQSETYRLQSDEELLDITYVEDWLDKEGETYLDRLFEDSVMYTSTYRHIKSWNPRMVGYHDMLLQIQTLKGYREAPDAKHFEQAYQKYLPGVTLSEEQKLKLPEEMREGAREKFIGFNDDCMDLKLMVAAAGQVEYWKENPLETPFLKKFTKKQLRFVYDLFGGDEEERIDIKDVWVSKGVGSEDPENKTTFAKFEKLVPESIDTSDYLKVPKKINNFFSAKPEYKLRKEYVATMIACLITKARKRLLEIDPDYVDWKTGEKGITDENDEKYKKLIKDIADIRDKLILNWDHPHKNRRLGDIVNEEGKKMVIKSSDIRLANIAVYMNVQEAWSSLYAGVLAGEYVYEEEDDEKDPENGQKKIVFKKEIGGLHSASDSGDATYDLFRKIRYQINSRDQGYIFLPDSSEQREEWMNSNEIGYKPAIERYLKGGEKEDLVLDEMWNFVFSQEKKFVEWRAKYNLKMDPELAAFLKSLAFAWETPYILDKNPNNVEGPVNKFEYKRLAVPIFILYPFVEFNFWNNFQIDSTKLPGIDGQLEDKETPVTPWYLMTHERREMSSFTYEIMKFNEMDYFDVTMDMWSEIFQLYYDTPDSQKVEERLIRLHYLKRGVKKEDLGVRGLKNVIRVRVPKYKENEEGLFEIETNADGSVKEELKFIPTEVFELGINPMIWAHHLAKKYDLLGPGGMNATSIDSFIRHASKLATLESYYNSYKKDTKRYRDAAVLLTLLQAMCLSRVALVAGQQDRKDMWKHYGNLTDDIMRVLNDQGVAELDEDGQKLISETIRTWGDISAKDWKQLRENKPKDTQIV